MPLRSIDHLLAALAREDLLASAPDQRPEPSGISTDSRTVQPGDLYLALRGTQFDGRRFAADAVHRGAVMVAGETAMNSGAPEIIVRDGFRAALVIARHWFDHPAESLVLVGVTGTNGKTTTTGLVRHILNQSGSAASVGTLGAFDGIGAAVPSTAGSLTTPGPVDLVATLAELRRRGTTHVAMEVSSHALDQRRMEGLTFVAAVFTNLTRDHLDYHETMDRYRAAKLRLVDYLGPSGTAVLNADDPAWARVRGPRTMTFGITAAADLRAADLALGAGGSRFRLAGRFGSAEVALPLLGDFNVANALAAAGAGLALDLPLSTIAARLSEAPQVPGRMERIATRPCVVLRDYAHTPDALERALKTLNPLTPGRLIVVFGCGGDRDRGKRPIMGRVAAEHADLAIVTSDNPRTEDPEQIISDVEAGMGSSPRLAIVDRREAIGSALGAAREGDTILLAGKGHETYQVVGTEKLPFDEREIVLAAGAA